MVEQSLQLTGLSRTGLIPETDCAKTSFNFRKLLSLWQIFILSGRVFTYKTQFTKLNLSSHALCNGAGLITGPVGFEPKRGGSKSPKRIAKQLKKLEKQSSNLPSVQSESGGI